MKIVINLSIVRFQGAKNYLYGFVPALAQVSADDNFLIFLPDVEIPALRKYVSEKFDLRPTRFGSNVLKRVIWEQMVLPKLARDWGADVLFAPFEIAPLSFGPVVLAIRNPLALLMRRKEIHASIGRRIKNRIQFALSWVSCRRAKVVFYPSEFAAKHLGDVLGVAEEKRRVVYHGVERLLWCGAPFDSVVLKEYGVESERYFLFVSTMYRYKHPEMLIKAFDYLKKTWPLPNGYKVLLVGEFQEQKVANDLRNTICRLGLETDVILAKSVPRAHLAMLYKKCASFVMPTTMETFGQMFVEAMASGAPILCADMPFARGSAEMRLGIFLQWM